MSSSLTTVNQMSLTNNKRAMWQYFGPVALTTQPGFYLFRVNNKNAIALISKKLTCSSN